MVNNQLLIKRNNIVVGLFGVCASFWALTYTAFEDKQKLTLFSILFLTGFALSFLGFKNNLIKNKKVLQIITMILSLSTTLLIGILFAAYQLGKY